MRIAVLGWGSLVWQPANRYGEICLEPGSDWREDGPQLPVEFARISGDGRLTLVILPGYEAESLVMWHVSCHHDVEAARANLAERETNAPRSAIHGVGPHGSVHGRPPEEIAERVTAWLDARDALDAAVWTGLPPGNRWHDLGYDGFEPDNALAYVASLDEPARRMTARYITRAPRQIDTPVRRALEPILS